MPSLAETWEPGDSADTWIFTLRKDVTFHDGKTLDQDDVINSIDYHKPRRVEIGEKGIR